MSRLIEEFQLDVLIIACLHLYVIISQHTRCLVAYRCYSVLRSRTPWARVMTTDWPRVAATTTLRNVFKNHIETMLGGIMVTVARKRKLTKYLQDELVLKEVRN